MRLSLPPLSFFKAGIKGSNLNRCERLNSQGVEPGSRTKTLVPATRIASSVATLGSSSDVIPFMPVSSSLPQMGVPQLPGSRENNEINQGQRSWRDWFIDLFGGFMDVVF